MILHQGVACRVLLMPEGEDVDSLLHTQGRDGLEACFEEAADGLDYCLATVRKEFAPREIVAWATGFLGHLSDNALRAYYLPRLADGLGLSEEDLRRQGGSGRGPEKRISAPSAPRTVPAGRPVGKDDQSDRNYLTYPVLYPEYIPHLQMKGFETLLLTDWGRAFWRIQVAAQGQDYLAQLGEAEKGFFTKVRSTAHRLEGEELAQEWEHICLCISEAQFRMEQDRLKEEIRTAQQSGDTDEWKRLMAVFLALNAPSREEE